MRNESWTQQGDCFADASRACRDFVQQLQTWYANPANDERHLTAKFYTYPADRLHDARLLPELFSIWTWVDNMLDSIKGLTYQPQEHLLTLQQIIFSVDEIPLTRTRLKSRNLKASEESQPKTHFYVAGDLVV